MTWALELTDGSLRVLEEYGEWADPLERRREYATRLIRSVESDTWGVSGDGREMPSPIVLRLKMHDDIHRSHQRQLIADLKRVLAACVRLRNTLEGETTGVARAHVTLESPTYYSYMLELTFYPTGPGAVTGGP